MPLTPMVAASSSPLKKTVAVPGVRARSASTLPPLPVVSSRERIALISIHGYVAAKPPLGAADTGGQVVYVLELARKFAQLGHEVDIWTRRFDEQPEIEAVDE